MSKICIKCGKEIPTNATFCSFCGTQQLEEEQLSEEEKLRKKLEEAEETIKAMKKAILDDQPSVDTELSSSPIQEPDEKQKKPIPVQEETKHEESVVVPISTKIQEPKAKQIIVEQNTEKKKSNAGLWIVLGVVLIVACVVIGISMGLSDSAASKHGTPIINAVDEPVVVKDIGEVGKNDFFTQTFNINGVSMKMIAVKGGSFNMGAGYEQSGDACDDEYPVHQVTLSDYYIGETEVTQELWIAVMGNNPSHFRGAQRPVDGVSWNDCQDFIRKLNQITGKDFRLPTEAQWEFAARGGNSSSGNKYSGSGILKNVAWYYENSGDNHLNEESWKSVKLTDYHCESHVVKTKQPNELGIYDMSGNVWEWCQDRYGFYHDGSFVNPVGSEIGSERVIRGGCWRQKSVCCRVSHRGHNEPTATLNRYGLRVVL